MNYNFKITVNGKIKYMAIYAHNLLSAFAQVKEVYPEGRIVLL